jgi:hypothetical protein
VRQKRVDLLLAVDDLDDDRQVLGEAQDFGGVQRLEWPKPMGPRRIVAPASCSSRAFKTIAS